ncbi:hypothetical protein C8A03DRAFT_37859 [Achaetomium macrosporum]|uniref:Uncharacterized protein n=1 Tax=Achaetomium macrosporum TaxID=79813 RepID=A0AAN7C303_9PEZI|nr:hypothetical protein C8A03DRAFT_37859 [Achaetomium macrosporum]
MNEASEDLRNGMIDMGWELRVYDPMAVPSSILRPSWYLSFAGAITATGTAPSFAGFRLIRRGSFVNMASITAAKSRHSEDNMNKEMRTAFAYQLQSKLPLDVFNKWVEAAQTLAVNLDSEGNP